MKKLLLAITVFSASFSYAQNVVNFDVLGNYGSWMDVFENPSAGGAWIFGDPWSVADLRSDFDTTANTLTLYPNFNAFANAMNSGDQVEIDFWTDGASGGNKLMNASTIVIPSNFNGVDLTFGGNVISNTLDASYEAVYFIKALDPDNNYQDVLGGAYVFDLPASGEFSVSVPGSELLPNTMVQYGFTVVGLNANPTQESSLGNIVIGPSSLGLFDNQSDLFTIYPNPATDKLFVENNGQFSDYQITSTLGNVVQTGSLMSTEINIETLNPGVYLFTLSNDNGDNNTKRLVIK